MILQALYNYYWKLAAYQEQLDEEEGGRKIAPPGMEWKTIPYIVVIKSDGTFVRLEKTDNQLYLIPKDNARTSQVEAQTLWDHCGYLLGIPKTDNDSDKKNYPAQFDAFNKRVLELPDTVSIKAVKLFYQKEEYLKAREDQLISEIKSSKGGRITFVIEDKDRIEVASLPEVIEVMDPRIRENHEPHGRMTCIVTGKQDSSIAPTHEKIALGKDSGPLIGIQKASGFDSYGKQQGFNAPISFEASDAIGTALKELLRKDNGTSLRIGNTVYIFWSSLLDREFISNYQKFAFELETSKQSKDDSDTPSEDPEKGVENLRKAMKMYAGGKNSLNGIDYGKERFFMLGLMPNSGRIAVKFWAEGTVQEMTQNILTHMEDFHIIKWNGKIDPMPQPQSLHKIIYSIMPKGKKIDKMSTHLLEELIESIVKNKPYPSLVQKLCLRKNRRERNVTEMRAAILKAFINRKNRFQKRNIVMQVGLDKNQTDVGYLGGRLLALYEYTQEKALGDVNTSIKDRFYSKASVVPRTVFHKMTVLHQKHIRKISRNKPKTAYFLTKVHQEIRNLFPGSELVFPQRFTLDQQNMFDNGYYHQSKELRTLPPIDPQNDKKKEEENPQKSK